MLGSGHGMKIGRLLQQSLGTKFDVISIYKPYAPLAKVTEDLGKFHKDFTKQGHIVTVGQPVKSLYSNYHYSTEENFNSTAEMMADTNVGFVSL
jgi:hypothetical protein